MAVPPLGAAARRQCWGGRRQQGEGKWPLVAGDVSPPQSWQWFGTALLCSCLRGATCCWGGLCSQAGIGDGQRRERGDANSSAPGAVPGSTTAVGFCFMRRSTEVATAGEEEER